MPIMDEISIGSLEFDAKTNGIGLKRLNCLPPIAWTGRVNSHHYALQFGVVTYPMLLAARFWKM